MRLPRLLPALSGAFAALGLASATSATHCGGTTAAPHEGPGDATSSAPDATSESGDDAQGSRDGGAGCGFSCDADDDVKLVACPASAPALGSACSLPEAEQCEYGGSWWLGCNLIVRCTQGVWKATQPGQVCVPEDAGGSCPATWAEASGIDAGFGTCPAPGCQYPEGYCECLAGCGGGGAIRLHPQIVGSWYCAESTPQCPSPRPDLGTSCGDSDASCQYGTACGCGEQLHCTDGVWQGYALPPCP